MNETSIAVVAIVILTGLFLTGMEIAFAMAIVGAIGYAYIVSPQAAVNLLANDVYDALSSYSLSVIPLFVLMGQITFNAGLAGRLYDTAQRFLGHVHGGLALATIAGATMFKAVCGSSVAAVATLSSVAIPEMDRFGYDKKLSCGIVATIGTIGMLIPPSVTLIILGLITQQSIGKLFLAGMIPGLLLSFCFAVIVIGWCKINPSIGPVTERVPWGRRFKGSTQVLWPVIIFVLIIGGLMSGFFTPTESGSVGAFAVLVLCVVKKDINFKGIRQSIRESVRTTCMVILILALSIVFSHFIAVTNLPSTISEQVVTLPLNRNIIIIFILLIYLIGGSFIDDAAFMIMATPIFFPAMVSLGYDPIWVCIIIALTGSIGAVIPPVALCVFIVKAVTKIPMNIIYKGVYPFLIALIGVVVLTFVFPKIVLYLPSVLMK